MGLADVVRTLVQSTAQNITAGLQVNVLHAAKASVDGDGKITPAAPVTLTGLVIYETKPVRTADGKEALSQAQLTFLSDVAIGLEDTLTLPGSVTGPILKISKPADPAGGGYLTQVWLG